MNRKEEFIELIEELEQTPVELEFLADKAIAKVRRKKRISMLWKTPLISIGTTAAAFILLVNLFPAVALAMSNMPILKDLVAAVSLDPSMKAAVENDYYQVVGVSQTQKDVSVMVEYMIVDANHISIFFRVDAPIKEGTYSYDFTDAGKNPFPAVISMTTIYEVDKLQEINIDFVDGYEIPEEIIFSLTINQDEDFQSQKETTIVSPSSEVEPGMTPAPAFDAEKPGEDYSFRFELYPDSKFTNTVNSIPIDQWIELNDVRVYLEKLDIFPTQARLDIKTDESNTAIIRDLNIHFTDNGGNNYDTPANGLVSVLDPDTYEIQSLYFESSFFSNAEHLSMYIEGLSTIDKDKIFGDISFAQKSISNMPEGVSIDSMELKDSTLYFTFKAHTNEPNHTYSLLSFEYYDKNNNKYNFGTSSTSQNGEEENIFYNSYQIENYEENKKYQVRWEYASEQILEESKEIIIK